MSLFSSLFKTRRPGRRIVAFVDYEHWYYSMQNLHRQKPDIGGWFRQLSELGQITDCIFFADFTQPAISDEIGNIRQYSSKIIETRNPNPKFQKDYTDFILLDSIYQRAYAEDNADIFIIFSGDGHFSSVAAFLKNYRKKEVGIYAVKGALSKQLKDSADWSVELPDENAKDKMLFGHIFAAIRSAEENPRNRFITFTATLKCVAETHSIEREKVRDALRKLIDGGYIAQEDKYLGRNNKVRIITVDWDKVKSAGYAPSPKMEDKKK